MFADVTYEGARSITGPFLQILGASGAIVGIVAGLGELLGYTLRFFSGYIADRTRQYWAITILGYFVNLAAVPLLALAGRWEIAAGLMVTERIGKAVRTPARDAMLSHAASRMGRGWAFGLHEALDQIGAVTGPLIVAFVLSRSGSYHHAFAWLAIPAAIGLSCVIVAALLYPNPREFEMTLQDIEGKGLPRAYWIYLTAAALVAAGFADFPLIAFHLKKTALISDRSIPLIYSLAMGVDAIAALFFGRLFDRIGLSALVVSTIFSMVFAPLVFLAGWHWAFLGMALWGIGLGAQESIMRAAVGGMIPVDRRASAYGVFNAVFGIAWFVGSAAMGILYDISIVYLVIFSIASQCCALFFFLKLPRRPV